MPAYLSLSTFDPTVPSTPMGLKKGGTLTGFKLGPEQPVGLSLPVSSNAES